MDKWISDGLKPLESKHGDHWEKMVLNESLPLSMAYNHGIKSYYSMSSMVPSSEGSIKGVSKNDIPLKSLHFLLLGVSVCDSETWNPDLSGPVLRTTSSMFYCLEQFT